jgi:uncharacterized protein YkwD
MITKWPSVNLLAALALIPCLAFSADLGGDWVNMEPDDFWKIGALSEKIEVKAFNPDLLEAAIFHETNHVRAEHDRRFLEPSAKASDAARSHSRWMVEAQMLSHSGAMDDGKRSNPFTRLQAVGLSPTTAAENVAFTFHLDYEPGRTVYIRERGDRRIFSYKPGGTPLESRTYLEFARAVVQQLMDSPTHRDNILLPEITHAGIGVVLNEADDSMDRIFVTQNFFSLGGRGAR